MTGLEEFLKLFGDITLSKLIMFIFAGIFLFSVYKEIKKYINVKLKEQQTKAEQEKEYKKKLEEAWNATQKYPEYRKKSIEIQGVLEDEIQEVRNTESTITKELQTISSRLEKMEQDIKRREMNQLRDLLLNNYRRYTNKELNPSQSWTNIEAETFWALFSDYEDAGGNGHMHTTVKPEMERLVIVNVNETHTI